MNKTILIVAGLILAVLAGRYMIPAKGTPGTVSKEQATQSALTNHDADYRNRQPSSDTDSMNQRNDDARPVLPASGVFINRNELSHDQVNIIAATYHYLPPAGRYWYDTMSGAWGVEGHETAGFLLPGHDFGPLPEDASAGDTGVFVNGRQLNMTEAMNIQRTFGAVYRGRWWLDGRTGNFGLEGNPVPAGNLIAMLRSRQNTRSGDNFWCSATACGNDDGHTGYVNVDGTIVSYEH